jgi:uncharacterized protein YhbP (UPF0306 family)
VGIEELRGVVVTGKGQGRHFTGLAWARDQFIEKLGIDPQPGTLNLQLVDPAMRQKWIELRRSPGERILAAEADACDARCFHVDINRLQAAAIVWPQVESYPEEQIELIAACALRQKFGLTDGCEVAIQVLPSAEALRRTVQAYLSAHNVLSLATYGVDGPWAASVFYVHREWTFYFLSGIDSRHSRNISAHSRVSATINPDYADWRQICGVQLEGEAALLTNPAEVARCFRAYRRKYPFVDRQQAPAELAQALRSVRLYRLVPERLLFVDNSRGLGHREAVEMGERDCR